jgi:Leucine-rich repeat (LRR) protein
MALLVAVGLLALVPLVWWLVTVLRFETPNGTLVVQINHAETEARIKNGKLTLLGPDGKVRYTLSASERSKQIEAGPYKVRVEGADGVTLSTTEFTLTKGDKVTVRVTAVPKAGEKVAKAVDPDRKAAEWVLSVGGTVKVNGQDPDIKVIADLPRPAFQLTWIDLHDNKHVSDAALAPCKDCKSLVNLNLDRTQVTDAGLAWFKDCKKLMFLSLVGTKVGDAGLAHLKDCKGLGAINLNSTQVSDSSLASFRDYQVLWAIDLGGTKVSDAGLAPLKDCKILVILGLAGTKVSNAGLPHLKECKKLTSLVLSDTKVSDLSSLKGMKLQALYCNATQVSDLSPLLGMPLKDLRCDFKAERDTKILRSITTLETINGKPVKEFWKEVEAKKP